jgi:YD repeat-containing protein
VRLWRAGPPLRRERQPGAHLDRRQLHATGYSYDGAKRRIEERRGDGSADQSRYTFKYDRAGNTSSSPNPRTGGVLQRQSYDDLNRAFRSEDGAGNVTSRAYGEAGNILCEKQPLGGTPGPVAAADAPQGMSVGQLRDAICAGSFVTQRRYEELGKLVQTSDAAGRQRPWRGNFRVGGTPDSRAACRSSPRELRS